MLLFETSLVLVLIFVYCRIGVVNDRIAYLNGMGIKDETGKWTALNVFSLIGDGNLPFACFIWLESSRVDSVVVGDGTIEYAIGR